MKRKILEITAAGLRFIDTDGEERYIDFAACQRNWIDYIRDSEEFPPGAADCAGSKNCVGWRKADAKPIYIEFFSNPRTRFEFFPSLFGPKPYRRLVELQEALRAAGWRTFDLS